MKRTLLIILTIFTTGLLNSCDYLRDNFTYSNTTKEFMTDLMHNDYDKCVSLMQASTEGLKKDKLDTVKAGLVQFRTSIVKDFGDNLDYSFMREVKSMRSAMTEIPNTTTIVMQFSNDTNLGVIQVLFSNKTGKILNIKSMNVNEPIPDMSSFWLFGVVALCIPIFNIYMIRRVKRSDMAYKWLRYLAIIVLNFPAIGYAQVEGVFLRFDIWRQFVMGFSFVKMGYPGSTWIFGVPLASLYFFYQLKTGKYIKAPKPVQAELPKVKGKRFKGKS